MFGEVIISVVFFVVCAGIVPIYYMWQSTRRKMNEIDTRKQIVLAAIEKNKETDVEELLRKMAPPKKLLKEKLLEKLLAGCIISFIGISILACALWLDWHGGADPEMLFLIYFFGGSWFAIGLALIIYYFVGKKMLAKEIEAEEKRLIAEAKL